LNLPYFISKRISGKEADGFSGTIHKIAVASISIGLAIMIISFLILKGFQEKIQEKIVSFDGHLQVTKFTLSNSYEEEPISTSIPLLHDYSEYPYIAHVQEYASKAGLLKANEEVMGVVLKGVSESFNLADFQPHIMEGRFPRMDMDTIANEIMISRRIADKLSLSVGDNTLLYFIQNPPRVRRLNICGIYETGMEDFDDKLIMGDLRLIQRINNWPDTLVGGVEIFLKDFNRIEKSKEELEDVVGYELYIEKVTDKYAEIFDWLALLNRNVVIFLSLTLFVACFNMVSILLILMMERTQMIGVLKATGAANTTIRKIFIYNGILLIAKGLLIGNLIGLLFGFLQGRYQFLKLDANNYYMEFVPISWNWVIIVILNLLTFSIVSLSLYIPTTIIARIPPIKAIRFD
jgi:lipoprotein-releasing system permease protein